MKKQQPEKITPQINPASSKETLAQNREIRVIVGMSGGVDSSVTALLLLQQGYQVEGLFMKNWEEDDTNQFCSAAEDVADAQTVCDRLGISLHRINFAAEYWDNVFEHFLTEYKAGRTPNPDILCNKEIKFKAFLDYARHLGADYIATGHYAQITKEGGKCHLLKGLDSNKDQSYFLYTLGQDQLAHSLFPLGELEKSQVRELAKEAQFSNHNKKDSTGICFIGERKFKQFLQEFLPAQPGEIVTEENKVIGQHEGLMYHTIGQRQGLGIGGQQGGQQKPWYVIKKKLKENQLIVSQNTEKLLEKSLSCTQTSWVQDSAPQFPLKCTAKIRYRQKDQACTVQLDEENQRLLVKFEEAQRAIAPGQSIVFYQGNDCIGGGIINENQ